MKPLIIGIAGGKGEGKDTVAQMIIDRFPLDSVRIAFADSLKMEVARACGMRLIDIENDKQKYRPILQWWGTEFRRSQDDQYWIIRLNKKVSRYDGSIVVIPDVRFPNEFDYIKEQGGVVWNVTRDIYRDHLSKHASEVSLIDFSFDFTFVNNGTLDELRANVDMMVNGLKV